MKNSRLTGIFPAMLTAFDGRGVDTAKVAAHAKRLADAGVHGLYVGGSSGEMILMTEAERKTLLETVIGAVDGVKIKRNFASFLLRLLLFCS